MKIYDSSEYLSIKNPENKDLEFFEYRLRRVGVRRMSASKDRLLNIETDGNLIQVDITTYEVTRRALDRELSRLIEQSWIIGRMLDFFDEIWDKIDEYVNEPIVREEGQEE